MGQRLGNCTLHRIGSFGSAQMAQHHGTGPDLSNGIGNPPSADGAIPIDPTTAGPRSDRMSPKRFEPTTTSNQSGWRTKWAVKMSMWYWSVRTSEYAEAISWKSSSQKGMV